MENKKKKRYGIIAALLLLVLAAGVGTYAWLTATQTKVNEFTVGSIDKPEVKPDPDQPNKPGDKPTDPSVDGYLFETKWTDKSKMIPGTTINKNPNVGIGKDDTLFALIDGKVKFERMGKDRKMCSVYAEQ